MNRTNSELDMVLDCVEQVLKSLQKRIDLLEQQVGLKVKVNDIEPIYSHTDTGLFCAFHKESMVRHKKQDRCHIVFGNFERIWLPDSEIDEMLKENKDEMHSI
jgi:hypothetical protein